MNNNPRRFDVAKSRRAFTLREVMIALAITLILMGLVMEMFTRVSAGINNSRTNMELNDQLRQAKHRLILDLRGTTAPTVPPVDPNMHLGYFEYVEGPRVANSQYAVVSTGGDVGEQLSRTSTELVNTSTGWYQTRSTIANNFALNSIIGDTDDILMFTTCSYDDKFVGKAGVRTGFRLRQSLVTQKSHGFYVVRIFAGNRSAIKGIKISFFAELGLFYESDQYRKITNLDERYRSRIKFTLDFVEKEIKDILLLPMHLK